MGFDILFYLFICWIFVSMVAATYIFYKEKKEVELIIQSIEEANKLE